MKGARRVSLVVSGCAVFLAFLLGCGASENRFAKIEADIDTLSQKGLPDSLLTDAKLVLAEARGNMKAANMGLAGALGDSAAKLVENAKARYDEEMQRLRPEVTSVKEELAGQMKKLSGQQLRVADSIVAEADSFATMDWLFAARDKLARLEKAMPGLQQDEKTASSLRRKVTGTWREDARPDGVGFTAVQTTIYKYKKDGSFYGTEQKKGTSNVALKENWKFESWGSWDLKGDTILMFVDREKCHRQIYDVLMRKKDGSTYWKRNEGPAYDSTYTRGRKDKHMVFSDLKAAFRKVGK